jgi:hypothetical protein
VEEVAVPLPSEDVSNSFEKTLSGVNLFIHSLCNLRVLPYKVGNN